VGEDSISRLFAKIDEINDKLRDGQIRQEKSVTEMKADIRNLREAVSRFSDVAQSHEDRIEAHNIELIKINERIKTALWIMAGVYTLSQVLGLWDRVRVLMWG